jgi:hypothetical protein
MNNYGASIELYLQGKTEALRQKNFPSAHQSNTYTTLTGMGSNPGLRGNISSEPWHDLHWLYCRHVGSVVKHRIHKSVSPLSLATGNNFGKSLASFYTHERWRVCLNAIFPPSTALMEVGFGCELAAGTHWR